MLDIPDIIHLFIPNSIRSVFYNFLDHFTTSYTKRILVEALQLLGQLWPYLVMGIVVSTIVKVFVSKEQMALMVSSPLINPNRVTIVPDKVYNFPNSSRSLLNCWNDSYIYIKYSAV